MIFFNSNSLIARSNENPIKFYINVEDKEKQLDEMFFPVIFLEIYTVYSFSFFEAKATLSSLTLYSVFFFQIFRSIVPRTNRLFLLEVHAYIVISKNVNKRLKFHSSSIRCINQVKEIIVKLIYYPFEHL